ncbi:MAG: hypothetical protein KKB13_16750 [Chloroflexi bacterium]|nr:hypothetical protein [Chloroflexota bacterium]
MSKYEWERGTIKVPARAWRKVVDRVLAAYNQQQETRYQTALQVWTRVCAAAKGRRGVNWADLYQREVQRLRSETGYIRRVLWPGGPVKGRPRQPRKKDFPRLPARTTVVRVDGDTSIAFDHRSHTVRWTVSENNHAVETAREHPVAQALFDALLLVQWTRHSGGVLVGNDEYHRDADYPDGGGNYVTACYGPLGDRNAQRMGW